MSLELVQKGKCPYCGQEGEVLVTIETISTATYVVEAEGAALAPVRDTKKDNGDAAEGRFQFHCSKCGHTLFREQVQAMKGQIDSRKPRTGMRVII